MSPVQYHKQTLGILRQAAQIRRIRLELEAELASIDQAANRPDEQTRRAWREAEKARREF